MSYFNAKLHCRAKEGEPNIQTDTTLEKLAKKYSKTPAQIALKFQIQRGLAAVPKSNSRQRQLENISVSNFFGTAM